MVKNFLLTLRLKVSATTMKKVCDSIDDNKYLTEMLVKAVNDRFLLSDFPKYDDTNTLHIKKNPSYIFLPCQNEAEVSFLKQYNYPNLIADILMYSVIPGKLRDMALCVYAESDIESITSEFYKAQNTFRYIWREDGLVFEIAEFFVDIVVQPISQFHTQLTNAYKTFTEILEHIPANNLFLEANSPSYLSQYAQYWVAEKLGLLNYYSNIAVI